MASFDRNARWPTAFHCPAKCLFEGFKSGDKAKAWRIELLDDSNALAGVNTLQGCIARTADEQRLPRRMSASG
jgi:hypothetical protein